MIKKGPLNLLMLMSSLSVATTAAAGTFLEDYPLLNKQIFQEPESKFRLGFGVTPIGVISGKYYVGIHAFELHWMSSFWDWEIFNSTFGMTRSQNAAFSSTNYAFRTAPKFRFTNVVSFGGVWGREYVTFAQTKCELEKDQFITPVDDFSSYGDIYGVILSENFPMEKNRILKVNQIIYKQTYPVAKTPDGWRYYYIDTAVNSNPTKTDLNPSYAVGFEFSILY